jgi:hypothetical protein
MLLFAGQICPSAGSCLGSRLPVRNPLTRLTRRKACFPFPSRVTLCMEVRLFLLKQVAVALSDYSEFGQIPFGSSHRLADHLLPIPFRSKSIALPGLVPPRTKASPTFRHPGAEVTFPPTCGSIDIGSRCDTLSGRPNR